MVNDFGRLLQLLTQKEQGVPKIVKLKPEHNHPPNAVEREATVIRCEIRERCLREPTRRPRDIIMETLPTCKPEVRDFLSKHIDTIKRDMLRTRASGEIPKRKKGPAGDVRTRKKAKTEHSPSEATTPQSFHQYMLHKNSDPGLTPLPPRIEDADSDMTPPLSRVEDEDHDLKQDLASIKNELILEDYGNSEDTFYNHSGDNESVLEEKHAYPSTSKDLAVPFETVICDSVTQVIQVKQEIVEDESDNSAASQEDYTFSDSSILDVCPNNPSVTEPRRSSHLENIRMNDTDSVKTDSLNALARLANTLGPPIISSQDIPTLMHSVPASNHPLVMPTYFGPKMTDSYSENNSAFIPSAPIVNPAPKPSLGPFKNLPALRAMKIPSTFVSNTPAVSTTNLPTVTRPTNLPDQASNLPAINEAIHDAIGMNCNATNIHSVTYTPLPDVTSTNSPAITSIHTSTVSSTTLLSNCASNLPVINSTNVPTNESTNPPAVSSTTATTVSATNLHSVTSNDACTNLTAIVAACSANPPAQPPRNEDSSCRSDFEGLEGIFISLQKVPKDRRKRTKDKLLRLVKLITELDLDPDDVSFSVTMK